MFTIGLTGGIASGKSTVSAMLQDLGAHIIDADKIGHAAYAPGTRGFEEVVAAFGRDIVGEDGAIDRKNLGAIVFASPEALQRLNAIVHPIMRDMIEAQLNELRQRGDVPVAVVEAAILIEAGWTSLVDEVWVTVVPVEVARERLIGRNGLTAEQADARIHAQMTNDERLAHAQRVIDNSGSLDDVRARVEQLWSELPHAPALARGGAA